MLRPGRARLASRNRRPTSRPLGLRRLPDAGPRDRAGAALRPQPDRAGREQRGMADLPPRGRPRRAARPPPLALRPPRRRLGRPRLLRRAGGRATRRARRGGAPRVLRRDRGDRAPGRPLAGIAQVHRGVHTPRPGGVVITVSRRYTDLVSGFRWAVPEEFNFGALVDAWATDRSRVALYWEDEAGRRERHTFWDVKQASNRCMTALAGLGVGRGDPLMVMLPRVPAWQTAIVGGLKLGALVIPCTASLRAKDIAYRARHSGAKAIVTTLEQVPEVEKALADAPGLTHRVALGGAPAGWHDLGALLARASSSGVPARTRSDEPALYFYTSGTTREPKAVLHTHAYTFAHRYTGEYWLDLQRTDLHWTTSDTGWAKAAYGVLFGPWMNGVPVLMFNGRFDPERELDLLRRNEVTVFCAPPTEYRLLVKQDLGHWRLPRLRHCTGAGEPLNPEVIHAWHDAFGLPIHDGYGHTERILLAANLPGLPIRPGSMGKPFPGHDLRVIREDRQELPAGDGGDLALRGHPPSLFREY